MIHRPDLLHHAGDGVSGLDGADDAFRSGKVFEGLHSFFIRDSHVAGAADGVQVRMLRADSRVVKTGGNGIDFGDIAVIILTEERLHAMEDTDAAPIHSRCMVGGIDALAACFTADELHILVLHEGIEGAGCIAAAADTGIDLGRKAAGTLQDLRSRFTTDAALEIADHFRKRSRPRGRADDVVRIITAAAPFLHRCIHGILQYAGASLDDMYLRPEELHAIDVQRLSFGVDLSHEDLALHTEKRRNGGCCHAVLSRACFCDDACLAHALGKERLPDAVIDLVRARVIQILTLQENARPAQVLFHVQCFIEHRRTTGVVHIEIMQLILEAFIILAFFECFLYSLDFIHQDFRNVLSAKFAKSCIHSGYLTLLISCCLLLVWVHGSG